MKLWSRPLTLALAVAVVGAGPMLADEEYFLRVVPGSIEAVESRHDLDIEAVGDPDGALFLIEVEDEGASVEDLLADPDVVALEEVVEIDLADSGHQAPTGANTAEVEAALGQLGTGPFASGSAWVGFLDQAALAAIDLEAASGLSGAPGRVAILDSGIDPDHPLLAAALLPGYDFVKNRPGASEWEDLDSTLAQALIAGGGALEQSTVAILGQSTVAILGQSTVAILGQSTVAILGSVPPTFGHGTMVAGLVRRVAPGAEILPLKVFDHAGRTTTAWLVRAVYHALAEGATVINLSFTLTEDSRELATALRLASARGVVVVAAAGNAGSPDPTLPALWPGVLGVGAVGAGDLRSSFSNYGDSFVDLAAPGEGLITAFPGGGYAAAWGTSFSAPLVSAAAALAQAIAPDLAAVEARLTRAEPLPGQELGAGRLDLEEALAAVP